MNTARALLLLRIRLGLTQEDLSQKTQLSSIGDLETGRRQPRLEELESYSKVFGVSVSAIVRFAEELDDPTYLFPPLLAEGKTKGLKSASSKSPRMRPLKNSSAKKS